MSVESIDNRYRIVRELGKGGMGMVYLVEDTLRDDRPAALKTIRADLLGEQNLTQFKYEFAALGRLQHPNLVKVYDFGAITGGPDYYFTMEYVPGDDLSAVAARYRGRVDYTWLYEITVQVCRALQYIHSRGFVHYDVKPRNIRIKPDGQVKLMDFGLIGEARGAGQLKIRGTPEYIAPEMIRGDEVDHRADLYSLGVTLYEIVAGQLPFTSDSSLEILRQHVEAAPEPLRHFVGNISEDLQNLILTLLDKSPARRYSSANAVVQTINALSHLDFPIETQETKRGYIQSGRFVGREALVARLQGLLMRMLQGQGRLVFVTGPEGVGKCRLVHELRLQAQLQRALVFEGICRAESRGPYRPWVPILRQVLAYQRSIKNDAMRLYGSALVKLMPELATQLGVETTNGPIPDEKRGLMDAVARFLLACDWPLVLVLSGLQCADVETIDLLAYLGQRAPEGRLLLCGVYRDDEVDESHPLHALVHQSRAIKMPMPVYEVLRVSPLSEAEAAELVKSMLGVDELPPGLLPRLIADTGGNPLFIERVMRQLVDDDLLQYDAGARAWRIDLDNLTLPDSIQAVARRRLARLDPDSLNLLQWAAVMGRWLDLEVLAEVSGFEPAEVFGLIVRATRSHVLVSDEQAGKYTYRFSDEQMREVIYSTLEPVPRSERHRRVGWALRERYPESEVAEELTWHFERSGDRQLAFRYARLAGDKARRAYASESAIQHYTRALDFAQQRDDRPADGTDMQAEFDILVAREECYQLIGNRPGQQADLDAMARLAEDLNDVRRRIVVMTRQVELATSLGNSAKAQQSAESALALAREIDDRQLEADGLLSLGQVHFRLSAHAQASACFGQARRIYHELANQSGEVISLRRLGETARRMSRADEARTYFEEALTIHRRMGGNLAGEAAILNSLGTLAIGSDYARARTYLEQSLSIARSIGDRSGQVRATNNLGMIYWILGLYGQAREYLEQAVQIERGMQGRSHLAYYLESLGRVYLGLEEHTLAQQVFEEGRTLSTDIGDRWHESLYELGLGRVALARGDPAGGRDHLTTAVDIQRELGTPSYLATSLAWLGTAYLALNDWMAAQRCTSEAVAQLEAIGNVADSPLQDIWWLRYRVLKAASGDVPSDEAWACLQRARETMLSGIASLSDEGLRRNYLNKVRINREIIAEWTRQTARQAAGYLPDSRSSLEAEPPPVLKPARLEDKLKRVLDISLRMNETHAAKPLLDYVMDQVIELSGAERGLLVLMGPDARMDFEVVRGMAGEEIERTTAQISYTVLAAVAQARQPVLLQDALTDERFGRQSSVLDLNLRSVLCIPMISRAELIGMIYADNRSISGRFSQADVDLLAIFANQAATAIENARLYEQTVRANQELETLAHTLEQRVADRTTELKRSNSALARRAVQLETSSLVAQHITSILDLDDLLNQVVQLVQARFSYYFVGVWLLNTRAGYVTLHVGTDRTGRTQAGTHLALDKPSVITRACKTGERRLVDDVAETADYLKLDSLPDTRSELALPLHVGGQMLGVLDIQSDTPAAFAYDDQIVLQILADQIAVAVRNAQLYASEQSRRQLAESLEQTGRVLSSNLNLREVPGRILEQLAEVVPYERGSVLLQRGNELRFVAQLGFPHDERSRELRIPVLHGEGDIYQQILATARPVIVDDVTKTPGWQQIDWLPVDLSWMGAPLIANNRVIGMISLTRRDAAAFSLGEATVASVFAGQAAIALENAQLYDQISQFNEQLEDMVQARTEELNQAYRNLERLDRTKTDFIEVAAHELRTPLTVIKGYAQLLENHPSLADDPELRLIVTGIVSGGVRLHAIVNSMLDVTKIDSEVLNMRKTRMRLTNIFENIALEFEAALAERKLAFTWPGLFDLPLVEGDPELMYKVFYHLINNAIKFTPNGGSITVTGRSLVQDGEPVAVEVVVSDTGIGIDTEHHDLIFEKFYQTGEVSFHSSGRTKFRGGGPGLGLAIAKGIVLAHGGRIWVESEGYDEQRCPGSHFHVLLPVNQ